MAEDRVLNTVLKFSVDSATITKVGEAARRTSDSVKQAEKEAAAAAKAAEKAAKEQERAHEKAAKAAEKAAKEQEKAAKKVITAEEAMLRKAEETKRKMNELRETSERLASLSMVFTAIGAAISGPIVASALKYVSVAGNADATSRKWLSATKDIERAQNRIGEVSARAILPYLEQAADLAEKAADFVQDNPEVINAALKIGIATTTLGAVGMLVGKGIRIYTDAKTLLAYTEQVAAAKLMDKAADKQVAAAAVMAGSKGAGGAAGEAGGTVVKTAAGAGLAISGAAVTAIVAAVLAVLGTSVAAFKAGQKLEKENVQGRQWLPTAGAALSAIPGIGILPGIAGASSGAGMSFEKLMQSIQNGALDTVPILGSLAQKIKGMADAADPAAKSIESTIGALRGFDQAQSQTAGDLQATESAVQSYINFKQQEALAAEQYNSQRNQIEENYAEQRVSIEKTYEQQRTNYAEQYAQQRAQAEQDFARSQTRQAAAFADSERQAEEDYYRQRRDAARNYGKEVQRAEEDHQRRMREIQKDHQYRMEDLAASRDALGMVSEMRSYERQRQSEEENYRIEASRRREDYAEQMADMEEAFREQREQRLENFEQQQKEQQEDFELQQQRAEEAYRKQLQELEKSHRDQLNELEKAKQKELRLLKTEYDKQTELRRTTLADEYRMMSRELGLQTDALDDFWENATEGWRDFVANISQINSNLPGYGGTTTSGGTATSGGSTGSSSTGGSSYLSSGYSGYGQPRAAGGYASFGRYILGEAGDEFVLKSGTTRAAEQMLNARLTQDNLLAGLANGASGGARSKRTLNQTFVFNGKISAADMEMVKAAARQGALEVMDEVIG